MSSLSSGSLPSTNALESSSPASSTLHHLSRPLLLPTDQLITRHVDPASPPDRPRQANCSAGQSRTKGLLCQRENIPLMAQLHRHSRRPGGWSPQLWRQGRPHLGRSVHVHRHGHDGLRAFHIPLAGCGYS